MPSLSGVEMDLTCWFLFSNSKCENVVDPAVQQAEYRICERCDCQWQRRNTTTIKVLLTVLVCRNRVQSVIFLNVCCYCSFGQGSILLWTHMLRPFYSRPIALNQEGRSLVNDVCKCVRHWRVREGWVGVSNFVRYLERASSGCGLLSGLGPIDWRLLFNVNGPSQVYHFSRHQRSWHLDAANQDASNGHIL